MTKHEQILSLLPVKFQEAIKVKTPIDNVFIHHIVSPANVGGIWLLVNDGWWYQLEEKDRNYDLVADAILNRLNEPVQS